jgi:hypothetical protein
MLGNPSSTWAGRCRGRLQAHVEQPQQNEKGLPVCGLPSGLSQTTSLIVVPFRCPVRTTIPLPSAPPVRFVTVAEWSTGGTLSNIAVD